MRRGCHAIRTSPRLGFQPLFGFARWQSDLKTTRLLAAKGAGCANASERLGEAESPRRPNNQDFLIGGGILAEKQGEPQRSQSPDTSPSHAGKRRAAPPLLFTVRFFERVLPLMAMTTLRQSVLNLRRLVEKGDDEQIETFKTLLPRATEELARRTGGTSLRRPLPAANDSSKAKVADGVYQQTVPKSVGLTNDLKIGGWPREQPVPRAKSRKGRPKDKLLMWRRQVIQRTSGKGLMGREYCAALNAEGLSTPISWQKNERCPKTYPEAYAHPSPTERKKWRNRIADEKYKATKRKPLAKTRD